MQIKHLWLLLVLINLQMGAIAQTPRLSGYSLGIGDWITVKDGNWDTREEYGTLPGFGVYFDGWGWRGSTGLQLKTAYLRSQDKIRNSLGDGELTIGRKVDKVVPRLILRVPLYDWSVNDALENEFFIGSGNVNLGLGLGGKIPNGPLPTTVNLGFDLEGTTVANRALADLGSSHGTGVIQGTYNLTQRLKIGVNTLFLFDYWRWIPNYWDQKGETRFSIVPGVVAGVRIFRAVYVDIKGGRTLFEAKHLDTPKYPEVPEVSYYLSLSMFQGF